MARTQQEVMESLEAKYAERNALMTKLNASLQLQDWFPGVFEQSGGRSVSVQHIRNPSKPAYKVLITETREVLYEGLFRNHPDLSFRLHGFNTVIDAKAQRYTKDDQYKSIAVAYGVPFSATSRGIAKAKHRAARVDDLRARRNKEHNHG